MYDILSELASPFQHERVKRLAVGRVARDLIGRLPIVSADTKVVLNDFARDLFKRHFVDNAYRGRYRADRLSGLMEELVHERYLDWKRSRPVAVAKIDPNRQTPTTLALKIAAYVYSRPGRRATQRDLHRYTNRSKADLEGLGEWLSWRYGS